MSYLQVAQVAQLPYRPRCSRVASHPSVPTRSPSSSASPFGRTSHIQQRTRTNHGVSKSRIRCQNSSARPSGRPSCPDLHQEQSAVCGSLERFCFASRIVCPIPRLPERDGIGMNDSTSAVQYVDQSLCHGRFLPSVHRTVAATPVEKNSCTSPLYIDKQVTNAPSEAGLIARAAVPRSRLCITLSRRSDGRHMLLRRQGATTGRTPGTFADFRRHYRQKRNRRGGHASVQ